MRAPFEDSGPFHGHKLGISRANSNSKKDSGFHRDLFLAGRGYKLHPLDTLDDQLFGISCIKRFLASPTVSGKPLIGTPS